MARGAFHDPKDKRMWFLEVKRWILESLEDCASAICHLKWVRTSGLTARRPATPARSPNRRP